MKINFYFLNKLQNEYKIVKTRFKIMIFIVNIHVVLLVEGQCYSFSHQLRSHKKGYQGFSTPPFVFLGDNTMYH